MRGQTWTILSGRPPRSSSRLSDLTQSAPTICIKVPFALIWSRENNLVQKTESIILKQNTLISRYTKAYECLTWESRTNVVRDFLNLGLGLRKLICSSDPNSDFLGWIREVKNKSYSSNMVLIPLVRLVIVFLILYQDDDDHKIYKKKKYMHSKTS